MRCKSLSRGATVIGTASERNHDYLRCPGEIPVGYGNGLADRVRSMTPGMCTRLDAAATQEALRVPLELVADKSRIGTGTTASSPAAS